MKQDRILCNIKLIKICLVFSLLKLKDTSTFTLNIDVFCLVGLYALELFSLI